LRCNLSSGGVHKTILIHKIVAEAFIPNPEGKETVNHKDECKTNNHYTNLEWLTVGENVRYGTRVARAS
jgi:hypothetical protein